MSQREEYYRKLNEDWDRIQAQQNRDRYQAQQMAIWGGFICTVSFVLAIVFAVNHCPDWLIGTCIGTSILSGLIGWAGCLEA